jgi:hypothetical protein
MSRYDPTDYDLLPGAEVLEVTVLASGVEMIHSRNMGAMLCRGEGDSAAASTAAAIVIVPVEPAD